MSQHFVVEVKVGVKIDFWLVERSHDGCMVGVHSRSDHLDHEQLVLSARAL
jgi:hypothetical protein